MNKTPEVSAVTLTRQAQRMALKHGFSEAEIREAMYTPKNMYPSQLRPDQWRRVTRSVCLVGAMDGETFHVFTMYPNGSQAPQSTVAA